MTDRNSTPSITEPGRRRRIRGFEDKAQGELAGVTGCTIAQAVNHNRRHLERGAAVGTSPHNQQR